MTQTDLAKRLGVTQQTIGKWETGAATPSLEMIGRVSKLFAIPTAHFVSDPEIDILFQPSITRGQGKEDYDELYKRVDQITSLALSLEVILNREGSYGMSIDLRGMLERTLLENEKVCTFASNSLSLILDAFVNGSLELTKINLNRAIAERNKEPFDEETVLANAEKNLSKRISESVALITGIMSELPKELFKSHAVTAIGRGGDTDGNSETTEE